LGVNSRLKGTVDEWLKNRGDAAKCVVIKYFSTEDGLNRMIRNLKDGSVDMLDYVGHSSSENLMFEYGSRDGKNDGTQKTDRNGNRVNTETAKSWDFINNDDFADALQGKFNDGAVFNHLGCNGSVLAKLIADRFGIRVHAATGKTAYDPAGAGWSHDLEPSGMDYDYDGKKNPN
jgi:hypothetical protein